MTDKLAEIRATKREEVAARKGLATLDDLDRAAQGSTAPRGFRAGSRPATTGDVLTIYATGLGAVDPPIEDGANSCQPNSQCLPDFSNLVLRRTIETPGITIGGVQVPQENVLFSGLAPEFVAVNIVIIELPAGIAPGDAVPINISIGGNSSPPGVTIAAE